MGVDWGRIRAEFPALERWTFLNTATFGQLPRCATEAVSRHFAHRDEMACQDFLDWYDDADRIREQVALLLGCRAGDIAFFPTASAPLGLLLGGIDWRAGDRVVTLAGEFPNNLYYPALLGRRGGVEFVETPWERFYEAITARTRLVLMSTVNYTNGFRPPLEEVADFLHSRGIPLYLDGTQSVGALLLDTPRIRPAMLAVNAYKWLISPSGAAFAYIDPTLRARLEPNAIGWRSHRDWRRVDNLHHGAPEFVDSAEKYEGGMLAFPSLYAMGASLGMILEIGPAEIERRVMHLAQEARRLLRKVGARLPADQGPHFDSPILAACFEGRDASLLARQLQARGVQVSARHGNLRVSMHFYNNEEDLERLAGELATLV